MNFKLSPLDDELNCTHLYIERVLPDLGRGRVQCRRVSVDGRGERGDESERLVAEQMRVDESEID